MKALARAVRRRSGLRAQLALAIATVGLLALVINALLLSSFLNNYLVTRQGTLIAGQAQTLGRCCANAGTVLLLLQPQPLARVMQLALAGTPERDAVIVDAQGRVRYASPALSPALKARLVDRLRHDLRAAPSRPGAPPVYQLADQLVSDVRFYYGGGFGPTTAAASRKVIGGLLLAEDIQVVRRQWQSIVGLVILSGAAAVALAVLAGMIAAQTITRPLRAVTAAARGIAGGDYERRVIPAGPSETRELARSFNTMVDEVRHQRRVERDLLANVSHELAAPLGLIRGYAEALADGVIAGDEQRLATLHAIGAESARLGRLSGDLLDLALLETGQAAVHPEPVPVAELLAGLAERFRPAAHGAGVTLTVDVPASLPPLYTDALRLEQVLVNLLTNALRYTPSGGAIALSARSDGDGLRLAVADTGSGIPAEELPRIWERFYRVDKGRDRRAGGAGVGLGLAICRGTVTLLGGRISAESQPGHGATFTVWLPLRRQAVGSSLK